MAGKQPLKKKEVKSFNFQDYKSQFLGENTKKAADKNMDDQWILMPKAYQDSLVLIYRYLTNHEPS